MMNGKTIVIILLAFMVVLGTAAALFQPHPPAAVDVALMKQAELLGGSTLFQRENLTSLTPAQTEALIATLNYGLRIRDSLEICDDQNASILRDLQRRGTAARARILQLSGRNTSPVIDSFYNAAHAAGRLEPQNSEIAREYEFRLDRYQAEIFN